MIVFRSLPRLALVSRPVLSNQIARMAYDSNNKVHNRINDLIQKSDKKMFLFMKGSPQEPMCRYSGVTVQVLEAYGFEFDSFDCLSDDEIRNGIKEFSDWPTIPQVYREKNFIGGCDILLQMHQNGELKELADQDAKEREEKEKK